MQLVGMSITNTSSVKVPISDKGIDVNIYDVAQITVSPTTKGVIEGGNAEVAIGSSVTLTATPNAGYNFVNWTAGETVASEDNPYEFTVTGERTLTANFEAINYTINYILNDGALADGESNPAGYTVESETFTLKNPTKVGYTFTGWQKTGEETAATAVTITKGSTTGNLEYTATWTINQYNLKFVVDGSELVNDNVDYHSTIVKPDDPAKDGYTFAGWNPAVDAIMPAQNVTYTATWTPITYTIDYVLNGGSVATENPVEYTIESAEFTLTNPTKDYYTFAGWKLGEETTASMEVKIATGSIGNRSYTATWTPISYAISYDLNNGALADGETNPTSYTIESEAIVLKNPTREGYTFAGWTGTGLDAASTDVTIATGSNGARSYTATWTPITYTLSYELNGGSVATENPVEYTIESAEITLTNPTKDYYTFAGWTGTGLDAATQEVKIATGSMGNRSYTATWTPVGYAISYDLNGGALADGETNPTSYTIESEAIVLKNPTREGYTFAGWTGTGLDAASTAVTIAAGSNGARSYTATWTVNQYDVIYIVKGVEWARDKVNYGETITLREYTAEPGEQFDGWESDAEYTTMPAHDVTYTAKISIPQGIAKVFRNAKQADVYSMDGLLIKRGMTVADLMKMPKGIYIVNGNKIMIP